MEIDTGCRDVLSQVSWPNPMTDSGECRKQFAADEVNLAKVGLVGIDSYSRTVLNERSRMGVPFHTDARDQFESLDRLLREVMPLAEVECHDRAHQSILPCRASSTRRKCKKWMGHPFDETTQL